MRLSIAAALREQGTALTTAASAAGFMSNLYRKDATLWGVDAEPESSIRLSWVEDPMGAMELAEEITALRADLAGDGVTRVILCGMGGSSLGPEVMARAYGVELVVLDTVHPDVIAPLLEGDLSDVVLVVSSKSGGTVETDSLRRVFESAFARHGITPSSRIIVVTDPGSPLDVLGRDLGYRVFWGDPHVGGRFSALTAFGLVPAGLAGAPIAEILTDAHSAWTQLQHEGPDNDGLVLGAALASGAPGRNKLLVGDPVGLAGFGNWVEQLVAESTGKHQRGLLPVVGSRCTVLADAITVGPEGSGQDVELSGTLGELFYLWEVATVFACQILRVNPFDQPNVESAKVAAVSLLGAGLRPREGEKALGSVQGWASPPLPDDVHTSGDAIRGLLGHCTDSSYVGLCVFGPGGQDEGPWRGVAHSLEEVTARPVTLGFGPRFLHSTGQFHKGGPRDGVFLHIIELPDDDLDIPDRDFSAVDLLRAQAYGDANVLAATGQPVLSLTVRGAANREALVAEVLAIR